MTRIRRGDTVLVISGKEKGKTGKVDRCLSEQDRVVVEGLNMVTRHVKPRPGTRQGGLVQQEASLHVSNVKLMCNKCNQAIKPASVRLQNGSRVRGCPKCKEVIDDARQ
ncbi:MAG: 50S ribosomal protein L24 [SAR202 cluster bacterium]|nr:50S ribosomal protein L24 [SAR202 cluster bacterium]